VLLDTGYLLALVRRHRVILEALEWCECDCCPPGGACPVCFVHRESDDHAHDCELSALLHEPAGAAGGEGT
jgi:hypothetical protein